MALKPKISAWLLLLPLALSLWAWLDYRAALSKKVVQGPPVLLEIAKGDSFGRITDKLLAQHLPINRFWFTILAWQRQAVKQIKTGEFELTDGQTMPDILALLVSGKTKQYAITFPEGWNFQQVWQTIEQNPYLDHTLNPADPTDLMAKVGADKLHPEGRFFPDTYFFEKHTSDLSLLQRAYQKMQIVIGQEWQKRSENLPYKNAYEALIMASIIEKETAAKPERPLIAGVFVRRLRQGMRLQTDPTVIYGIGQAYQGDITSKDLKTLTPYNTYLISGLPPTPIAMPGREAINAALHPDQSDNLYFVAKGDGTHIFSATLAAHNQAVNQHQRGKK